jgi:hypothetical protein
MNDMIRGEQDTSCGSLTHVDMRLDTLLVMSDSGDVSKGHKPAGAQQHGRLSRTHVERQMAFALSPSFHVVKNMHRHERLRPFPLPSLPSVFHPHLFLSADLMINTFSALGWSR